MIAEISSHREELGELCRRFHVRRLDLFGSATSDDFDAVRSDLDFLVEFDQQAPEALSLKTFFGLKEALEALFGRSVDLVEPSAIRNPYFKESVERSRESLFEA
jgi:predicted nucleotidyltransferase